MQNVVSGHAMEEYEKKNKTILSELKSIRKIVSIFEEFTQKVTVLQILKRMKTPVLEKNRKRSWNMVQANEDDYLIAQSRTMQFYIVLRSDMKSPLIVRLAYWSLKFSKIEG